MKTPVYSLKWVLFSIVAVSILTTACKKDDKDDSTPQVTLVSEWSGAFTGNIADGLLDFKLYSDNSIILNWDTFDATGTGTSGSYTLSGSGFTFTVKGNASASGESSEYTMTGQGILNSDTGNGTYSIEFVNPNFGGQTGSWYVSTGITVQLNLPAEAEGKTIAIIFDDDPDPDNGYVYMSSGTCPAGTTVIAQLGGVPPGTYYLMGVVYVVGEFGNEPEPGDYVGVYGATLPNMPPEANAVVPASGSKLFDIEMVVLQ